MSTESAALLVCLGRLLFSDVREDFVRLGDEVFVCHCPQSGHTITVQIAGESDTAQPERRQEWVRTVAVVCALTYR